MFAPIRPRLPNPPIFDVWKGGDLSALENLYTRAMAYGVVTMSLVHEIGAIVRIIYQQPIDLEFLAYSRLNLLNLKIGNLEHDALVDSVSNIIEKYLAK